jgi:single-strand DNA-binding protein
MNNCILMAEVVQAPQLRYTSDNQTPISELTVQFDGLRDDDPPSKLKVVAWGNLAQEVQETYKEGDRVIVEGRLNMVNVDRPEGFKEKRAELTAQRIYRIAADASVTVSKSEEPSTAAAPAAAPAARKSSPKTSRPTTSEPKTPAYATPASEPPDYDEIPF